MADKMLIGMTESGEHKYVQCPSCKEIRKGAEFKLIHNEMHSKQTLDSLLQAEIEFEEKKKKIINAASKLQNDIKMNFLKNHSSTIKKDSNLTDTINQNSINYISFDGYFTVHKVNKTDFIEIKTAESPFLPQK